MRTSQHSDIMGRSSSEQPERMSMYNSVKYALVLATSVILLTGLGGAFGMSSGGKLLAWRWQTLASIPGVSACLPFELLNLAWALAGLLLSACPTWSKWYGANRLTITTVSFLTGSALEALYFLQTKDALPYALTRALILPMVASFSLPASYRLRLCTHGSGLLLCIAGACLRADAAAVSAVLCTALVVSYTTGALLPDFSDRSGQSKRTEKQPMVEGAVVVPTRETSDVTGSAGVRNLDLGEKQTEGLADDERAGTGGGSTGYVEKPVTLEGAGCEDARPILEGAAETPRRWVEDGDSERRGREEESVEGEGDEEDDFEERIMELAAAPTTARDSGETVFTGRPNASAALIDTAPDAAIASLLRDRAAARGPSASASGGVSASSGEAPGLDRTRSRTPGSFVLTNEERMATTTSRLIALAGAASGRVPRGGVHQPDPGAERGPPTRSGGVQVAAALAGPRISITGALPPAAAAVGMGYVRPALGTTGPSMGSGSAGKRERGSVKQPGGGSGLSKPSESRKGKEKLAEVEPAEAPRGPRGAGRGLRVLPGMSEREREALAATYAAVSAARAAEAMGAARPWGTGAGLPTTELDYRGPGTGDWQSPAWTGLGEEWLGWMQDMFFMGPGWDGGISRADDDREAAKARAAEGGAKSAFPGGAESEDEDDSDDDESYDFAKMEEKYKGLLGNMQGFGGGGFGGNGSGVRGDVSKPNDDVSRAGQRDGVALGGLGSGVGFAAAAVPSDGSDDEEEEEDSDSEDEGFDKLVGTNPGPHFDPLRSPAPNPWAMDFEQQKRLLEAIAQRKTVGPSANAGDVLSPEPGRADFPPARTLSADAAAFTIPHFVLDASSPVLKVEPAEDTDILQTSPGQSATAEWFDTTPPFTAVGSRFATGGLIPPPEYAPRFPDAQLPGSPADVLCEELEERILSSDRVEDVGAYLSTSERITQLLSAPAFTLDASVPAAIPPGVVPSGRDAGLGAPGMADVRAASERIAELLAAPSFTLDASVPAVSLEKAQQMIESRSAYSRGDGLQRPGNSRGGAENLSFWGENVPGVGGADYRGGSVGVPGEGLPTATFMKSSAPALESFGTPSKISPRNRSDSSSLRDRMTLRSGRSYPSPAKAAEGSFQSPAANVTAQTREPSEAGSRFRGAKEEGAVAFGGGASDERLTAVGGAALGLSLDASGGSQDGYGSPAGVFAAPTFTLDASRPAASLASAGASVAAPVFTLDASRPADAPGVAPSFTLDASKPVAAAPGGVGKAAGQSGPEGYAWTQMSERLARRSNGRGMSKVDQEWLKVMERVKDKLPQTQSGWKPELHIPFAALGN